MPSTQDQSVKKRQETFVKGGKGQAKDAVTYLTNSSETNWPLPNSKSCQWLQNKKRRAALSSRRKDVHRILLIYHGIGNCQS